MNKTKIRALTVEPHRHPHDTYLGTSIQSLKNAVSIGSYEIGDVESKRIDKDIYIIFNRGRIFSGLTPNRSVEGDIIAGVFYVLAVDKDGYPISLTYEQLRKYSDRFWEVEYISEREAVEANLEYMFKSAITE